MLLQLLNVLQVLVFGGDVFKGLVHLDMKYAAVVGDVTEVV